jgi:hypothetical protein
VARSTQAEIARRIDEVRPLLPECLSLGEIRTWTIKHTSWGASISISQLKRYLAVAREQIKEAAAIDRAYEVGATSARYQRIIAKAGVKGDYRTQLVASKQFCELFALEEPQRSKVEVCGQIDIGAAREALTELLARDYAEGGEADDEDADDSD